MVWGGKGKILCPAGCQNPIARITKAKEILKNPRSAGSWRPLNSYNVMKTQGPTALSLKYIHMAKQNVDWIFGDEAAGPGTEERATDTIKEKEGWDPVDTSSQPSSFFAYSCGIQASQSERTEFNTVSHVMPAA